MQFKHLPILALAALTAAQDNSLTGVLSATPELSNLTTLLTSIPGLVETLSGATDITILAPSNEAITALLSSEAGMALATDPGAVAALLTYHVLNGTFMASDISETPAFVPTLLSNTSYTNVTGGQVVEAVAMDGSVYFFSGLLMNSTVTTADVNFTGGVIHIIDTVLTLPATVAETALAANLTALAEAVTTAEILSLVNETPDLTIFAPTNEAFEAISSALANISIEDLTSTLAYHVINGTVAYSSDLVNGSSIPTLNGANVTITFDEEGNVFVNSAQVIVPNVLVANGVVHVIDSVLSPSETSGPTPTPTSGSPSGSPTPTASDIVSPGAGSSLKSFGMIEAAALMGVVGVGIMI